MKAKIRICIAIICLMSISVSVFPSVSAYALTADDLNVSYELTEKIVTSLQEKKRDSSTREIFRQWVQRSIQKPWLRDSHRAILETVQQTLSSLREKQQDKAYFDNMKTFRAAHNTQLQTAYDQPAALKNCFIHYPLVDAYARIVEKPTPLLLAMWYTESSCGMTNPANRDGLFQIVANDYEPGPVTRAWLQAQLQDFAAFMERKWNWYYSKNKTAPKELSHSSATYNALQTFAALYNGIDLDVWFVRYPLLNGNPYYFLGNYTADYTAKKDGLLVFYIKLSKLEADYFGK